ncbi:HAD family hydrolase [Candidatus Woesearchaeota archaeon]|nr:HAD family hydrolase [Candidatus Woesearchaeota archaeon]
MDFMGTFVSEGDLDVSRIKKNGHIDSSADTTNFCYEETVLRKGIDDFVRCYSSIGSVIISSDTDNFQIRKMLNGTDKYINSIYSGSNHVFEELYDDVKYGKISRVVKNLSEILKDHGLRREECVFIGDSVVDLDSAKKHGIDFFMVPSYDVHPDFSFVSLIHPRLRFLDKANLLSHDYSYVSNNYVCEKK